MTVHEQIFKEVATTEDSQWLGEVLAFMQKHQPQSSAQPLRGSYEAFMQFSGTMNDADAQEMRNIIDKEFSTIESE